MSDETAPDPLAGFLRDLHDLVLRSDASALRCACEVRRSIVHEDPVPDPATGLRWMRSRSGPIAEVTLTVEDPARADEMPFACYPISPLPLSCRAQFVNKIPFDEIDRLDFDHEEKVACPSCGRPDARRAVVTMRDRGRVHAKLCGRCGAIPVPAESA